ncbi:MAG: sigma-70 family RNA polymerase sigma factor [Pirellula sp.]|jgi:RNA polymerase primary sigma factor
MVQLIEKSKRAAKMCGSAKSVRGTKAKAERTMLEVPGESKPVRVKVAKLPATFSSKALEASFVHFCQLVVPEIKSPEVLLKSVKRMLAEEIEFMGRADFATPDACSSIFADGLLLPDLGDAMNRTKTPDLPPHLARLCEAKLLTSEEEHLVFSRMNYLKFRANQLRQELSLESPDCWTVRRIEALLKAADWYRDRMVKSNMRLVISIVKKFVNVQNSFDDLLSDGIVALLRAVDKFDVGLGFRFSTYATQVVRRNSYRRVMDKQKERQRVTLSVHEPGIDISDEHRSPSMSEERWQELRGRLSTMLDRLDRREKLIIRARFSLGGHRRIQTLQRLADKLGVSKERVRQLEKRALDKLRDMAELSPLPESDV